MFAIAKGHQALVDSLLDAKADVFAASSSQSARTSRAIDSLDEKAKQSAGEAALSSCPAPLPASTPPSQRRWQKLRSTVGLAAALHASLLESGDTALTVAIRCGRWHVADFQNKSQCPSVFCYVKLTIQRPVEKSLQW